MKQSTIGNRRFYVDNLREWNELASKSYFSDRALEVQEVKNAIILPPRYKGADGECEGGVCDEQFHFIAGLNRNAPDHPGGWFSVWGSYTLPQQEILQSEETVIFGGVLIEHFGHFILECLGRLWYILKNRERNERIVFIAIGNVKPYFYSFFELLDMEKERIQIIRCPMQFSSVIIPDESVHSWHDYTNEYLLPYRYITQKVPAGEHKKIYLTRSQLRDTQTRCYNEEYFEQFYREKGFVVISPEKLSLTEQISLMSGADEVTAILGSLTHWALFCKPGTKFTMLTRTAQDTLGSQCLINEAAQLQWNIVDVSMNFLYANRAYGVCLIGSSACWKKYVYDYYHEIIVDDGWKNSYHEYFLTWCRYYFLKETSRKILDEAHLDFAGVMRSVYKMLEKNESSTMELGKNVREIEKIMGRPFIYCQLKFENAGWQKPISEGKVCGDVESRLVIDAIKLYFSSNSYRLYYSICTEYGGWLPEVSENHAIDIKKMPGNLGNMIGIRIRLDDNGRKTYHILYRIHSCDGIWSEWGQNGEKISSENIPLNAVEIRMEQIT